MIPLESRIKRLNKLILLCELSRYLGNICNDCLYILFVWNIDKYFLSSKFCICYNFILAVHSNSDKITMFSSNFYFHSLHFDMRIFLKTFMSIYIICFYKEETRRPLYNPIYWRNNGWSFLLYRLFAFYIYLINVCPYLDIQLPWRWRILCYH